MPAIAIDVVARRSEIALLRLNCQFQNGSRIVLTPLAVVARRPPLEVRARIETPAALTMSPPASVFAKFSVSTSSVNSGDCSNTSKGPRARVTPRLARPRFPGFAEDQRGRHVSAPEEAFAHQVEIERRSRPRSQNSGVVGSA